MCRPAGRPGRGDVRGELVEVGGVRQVFKNPRDPYTRQLIESIPESRGTRGHLMIVGELANSRLPLATASSAAAAAGGTGCSRSTDGRVASTSLAGRAARKDRVSLGRSERQWESRTIAPATVHVGCRSRHERGDGTYDGKRHLRKLSTAAEYTSTGATSSRSSRTRTAIFNPFYRVERVCWNGGQNFGLPRREPRGLGADRGVPARRSGPGTPDRVLDRYPHQLSGGQRQRIMLARVAHAAPAFIVADEPVSMVDAQVRKHFLDILLDFQREHGMTTLFITHDLSTVYYLGGEVMVITKGQIVERGPVSTVMHEPSHPYTGSCSTRSRNPTPTTAGPPASRSTTPATKPPPPRHTSP